MRKVQPGKVTVLTVFLLLILSFITLTQHNNIAYAAGNYHGVALKSPTNVYSDTSRSTVLKSYDQGSILQYTTYSSDWYSAVVYVKGDWHEGYIHKSDVENVTNDQQLLKGIGLNNKTPVYQRASTDSKVWKSYSEGTVLYYKTFTSDWYEATVYINGKRKTGYIHHSHVENIVNDQSLLKGIGLKAPTAVYTRASTSSSKLKTYVQGSILYYQTFTTDWYEATVYINGKRKTGYIHHSHVENIVNDQSLLKGIGLKAPTAVYTRASTSSSKLKAYDQGTVLYYQTFTTDWYEATVYINGKRRTGYIHKSHVENIVNQQELLKGIGRKNPTPVFAKASTNSSKLKSYQGGTILYYQTFTSNWYEARIYLNGKPTTGYIHSSHVEGLFNKQETLEGRALKSTTHVYSKASRSSKVLKSYGNGSILKFRTFSKNWYEATVYVDGVRRTGYIHVDDVATDDITNINTYNYTFEYMVDRQMKYGGPKADGAGKIPASREQVEYYANPSNFKEGTRGYYQFLNLSQPAGLNAREVNKKILAGKGSLEGTGQAFIDAGKKYNINEAYLIAHTLHETGNGTSTLASGVPVDAKGNVVDNPKNAVYTVYNMYGYGARDACPIKCGAKYAFEHEWFTPSDAILGGASGVSQNYIQAGQDTLYKMKWNPENPATHQYATHVAWAYAQTRRIDAIYQLINDYTLIYEVPKFLDQPASSGDPNASKEPDNSNDTDIDSKFPEHLYGITNTGDVHLNLRSEPNGKEIDNIPNGSKLEIIASNGSWYKVKYDGTTGWAHSDYIELLNLIKITLEGYNLNVRPEPSTSKDIVGKVSNGDLLTVVLDGNKMVRKDEWYQVYYKGAKRWISGGKNGTEYVSIEK
ncbi:SH3 domain-containing protein [Virgibacillus oceani]|uniref:SH3b domain-containing protein n=1 Tax=Virgibacillus oceani TaxID=1479511 RepID=A0A917HAN0_9BACI|nr:SH3 domain-containing protein [Virgibacillus oceani]GGG73448.1 hypothetical protein GCM10011398_17390 [Virgibacillus oceani]